MTTAKSIAAQEKALERERKKLERDRKKQAEREAKARLVADQRASKLREKHARELVKVCKRHTREVAALYKKHGLEAPVSAACPTAPAARKSRRTTAQKKRGAELDSLTATDLRSLYRSIYDRPTRKGRERLIEEISADDEIDISHEIDRWRDG